MAANGSQTHGRPCRHIRSARPTGDGQWPLPRHVWWRSLKVAALARLCVFGGRRTRTRTLCIWRTLCGHVTIGTPMVIFCCLTVFWLFLTVFHDWYTVGTVLYQPCTNSVPKTVKRQPKQQKWPLVYQSSQVYQDCTNSVPIVKNSQKTVKTAKMTIRVLIVTGLPRLYQQCTKNSQKTIKTAIMNNVCVSVCRQNAKQFSAAI